MTAERHTLLVVDDEPEILESLRRLLRSDSYRVLTTTSAQEALQMLAAHSVDVLLSDIDMPGMNGLELIARVRKEYPEVVRMLLTGDASLSSALDAINRGEVHRYLTKPWNKGELRTSVAEALERLEELRRQGAADRQAMQHKLLLRDLELAYPGIGKVEYDRGMYVLDRDRIDRLISILPDSVTRAAFATPGAEPTVEATSPIAETRPSKRP